MSARRRARIVDALVAAGWTETEARNANVQELAREPIANHDAIAGEGLGRRLRRALYCTPTGGGLTRGELAGLLIDADDDEVTPQAWRDLDVAIEREIVAGRVVDGWAAGLVRYYLKDAPATGAELDLE
jgi:hypothetical protein